MKAIISINSNILSIDGSAIQFVEPPDPYNPLELPPYTIRAKFSTGYTPTQGDSQVLFDPAENVWDITKISTDWSNLFKSESNLLEVLGANSTGVTNFSSLFDSDYNLTSVALFDTRSCVDSHHMFSGCGSLTSVPKYDTSSCTNMPYMFYGCGNLKSVPTYDTSSCKIMEGMFRGCGLVVLPFIDTSVCTNMNYTFANCTDVQWGAYTMYRRASTQANPPAQHSHTFMNCGSNTESGRADLAKIPVGWK